MSRQSPNLQPADTLRIRYRIRFAKTGLLRWISHRDLARLWERIARRVRLPLGMTEGFHPTPRIAFPSALPLGVESLDEVVEIELTEELEPSDLQQRLAEDRQPGLQILRVDRLPPRHPKGRLEASDYRVDLPDDWDAAKEQPELNRAIQCLLAHEIISVERKGKTVRAHVDTHLPLLQLHPDHLAMRLVFGDGPSLKVTDVLNLLGRNDWLDRGATVVRTTVQLRGESPPDQTLLTAGVHAGPPAGTSHPADRPYHPETGDQR